MPNNSIHKFEGNIRLSHLAEKVPLAAENLLLRSCSLRNTDFVYGVAVFTGRDTKVMRNGQKAKYKFSNLDRLTN
jgi:magnesium-transporting ATPase (P-type)